MRQKKYSIGSRGSCSVATGSSNRNTLDAALRDGSMLLIYGDGRGISVWCTEGTVCLTQPCDPDDHTLHSGEIFIVDRKGLVAVTALSNARITISRQIM